MGPFDTNWLQTTITLATPLIFAAGGELIAERAGVINIGLEGFMLAGAFFSFLVHWATGDLYLGVACGVAAGMVFASIMALLSVNAKADQIVVGVGNNVLAAGVTTFAFREVFADKPQVVLSQMQPWAIPGLSHIPLVGRVLFDQIPLVYLGYAFLPVLWWVLYRSTWGLALRSAGEVPAATDTAGIRVERVRWTATLIAGGAAGLGGAVLSGQIGQFVENMSAGRGFIALAAVVFGAWRPFGVLLACLVFGAADALQLRLQAYPTLPREVWALIALIALAYAVYVLARKAAGRSRLPGLVLGTVVIGVSLWLFAVPPHVSFPSQLWLAVPYVAAILALAGVVGRSRAPSALSVPYIRGGG